MRDTMLFCAIFIAYHGTIVYICVVIYQTKNKYQFMNALKSIFVAMALTVAATVSAQTLKMEPQVVGVTTYEASTAINLVVVKPEIKLDNVDPAVLAVNTNGIERNVIAV